MFLSYMKTYLHVLTNGCKSISKVYETKYLTKYFCNFHDLYLAIEEIDTHLISYKNGI